MTLGKFYKQSINVIVLKFLEILATNIKQKCKRISIEKSFIFVSKSTIKSFKKQKKSLSKNRLPCFLNNVRESTLQKNVTIFIKIKERLLDSNLIEDSKNYFSNRAFRFFFRKLFF